MDAVKTPRRALFNNTAPFSIPPKDKLAMNSDTVKPMPPNNATPKICLKLRFAGNDNHPVFTKNQVKENMPTNFPNTSAMIMVKVIPPKLCIENPSKLIPAFAKAKSGRIR